MQDHKQPSFTGKLFRLLPRPTRSCPKDIGYHEVAAYGELLYRSRLNLPTTPADLAVATGCERWHTLPKVIGHLQRHGLADQQLRPLRDENKYFHRKRMPKHRWQDQFQTTTVYRLRPDAELTEIQNAVLWTVHSFNSNGKRPNPKSVARLLRLDHRTVNKHLQWLQEHGFLDADFHVIADPRHWQDVAPKLAGAPEAKWSEFASGWVAARYGQRKPHFALSPSHFQRSLQDACEAMAKAGYTSVLIRNYWEQEVPQACRGDCQLLLMDYLIDRTFWKMFEAVEKATARNRQLGKFHGDNSLGLLRKVTSGHLRAMKARLVEGGVEGLELWSADFSSLAVTVQPKARTATPSSARCAPVAAPRSDQQAFERLLSQDAPELDRNAWLPRILGSRRFKDDPEHLYLECGQALNNPPSWRERNLERVLAESNGKA